MNCVACDKPLSAVNRTGYCRQHYAKFNNSERTRQQAIQQWADPAMRVRILRPLHAYNRDRLSWCPVEYRDEYRHLTRVQHFRAADSRRMIEELIQADAARYVRTGQLQQTRRAA